MVVDLMAALDAYLGGNLVRLMNAAHICGAVALFQISGWRAAMRLTRSICSSVV